MLNINLNQALNRAQEGEGRRMSTDTLLALNNDAMNIRKTLFQITFSENTVCKVRI